MPHRFEAMSQRLLVAGIAPRHVRRYVRELQDHLADGVSAAQQAGHSLSQAQNIARIQLGSDDALTAAMLVQPALRSYMVRWPWAILGILPVICVLIIILILPCMLGFTVSHLPAMQVPGWVATAVAGYVWLVNTVGGLSVVALFGWMARRQHCSGYWAALGLSLAALCGAALTVSMSLPVGGMQGGFVSLSSPLGPHGETLHGIAGAPMSLARLVLGLLIGLGMLWGRRACRVLASD